MLWSLVGGGAKICSAALANSRAQILRGDPRVKTWPEEKAVKGRSEAMLKR
jgi:hypothetical protein